MNTVNEGKPALELVETQEVEDDSALRAHPNHGLIMITDDAPKEHDAMPDVPGLDAETMAQLNEYRRQMASLLPKENTMPVPTKEV